MVAQQERALVAENLGSVPGPTWLLTAAPGDPVPTLAGTRQAHCVQTRKQSIHPRKPEILKVPELWQRSKPQLP